MVFLSSPPLKSYLRKLRLRNIRVGVLRHRHRHRHLRHRNTDPRVLFGFASMGASMGITHGLMLRPGIRIDDIASGYVDKTKILRATFRGTGDLAPIKHGTSSLYASASLIFLPAHPAALHQLCHDVSPPINRRQAYPRRTQYRSTAQQQYHSRCRRKRRPENEPRKHGRSGCRPSRYRSCR